MILSLAAPGPAPLAEQEPPRGTGSSVALLWRMNTIFVVAALLWLATPFAAAAALVSQPAATGGSRVLAPPALAALSEALNGLPLLHDVWAYAAPPAESLAGPLNVTFLQPGEGCGAVGHDSGSAADAPAAGRWLRESVRGTSVVA